ncbi:cytochrome c [Paralcaligenes sp. KSB-10]|uniref:c-type cytochrome n=1 Tax=Paralcaligenes sp. KSB-10 TaxID=2901142 RepID=UPI001E5E503D|nr:cytochrome c [Paralcaligenes sp. KSB-10]UHL64390.1 cytochrome c [Paralcaligenes sp. KSB-10]
MTQKLGLIAVAALVTALSTPAVAQFSKSKDAREYRESAMTLMGSHFGRMVPVVKGQIPYDKQKIKENVALLNILVTLPWAGFGPGTEGGDAKDDIWLDPEGFKQAEDKLHTSMKKLTAAADAGDFDAFRVAFGDVGKSCKSCHDSYRKKK